MGKIVYTLKRKGDTDELHLFRAKPTEDNKCIPEKESICKKMDKSESTENIFTCYSEEDARIKCAKIGRQVCGTCISHLYETY
ncbi:hypothetical protein GM418_30590 [Maribellus comscasis]|uniref:Uncharacterized protein n=1 Tax=Maribellus comscasis TaxID=2681766 RepID=A0A6I6K312_9BACT|nr:hypothetical protein [Maribellus comscasis]QGY47848.1 hypothetical protein GM418_30590 [Maribellus comscasis]